MKIQSILNLNLNLSVSFCEYSMFIYVCMDKHATFYYFMRLDTFLCTYLQKLLYMLRNISLDLWRLVCNIVQIIVPASRWDVTFSRTFTIVKVKFSLEIIAKSPFFFGKCDMSIVTTHKKKINAIALPYLCDKNNLHALSYPNI